VTLVSGGTLLLHTDGVTEAMDAHGEQFGDERLQAAVRTFRHHAAQEVCEQILGQVTAHSGPVAQHDDITLVCIQAR
jgi:sigma-B regulation protein RsbU (phosphoserine phosphatase)